LRGIEVVEGLGDAKVRVRIVVLGEFLSLVAQVRLDLELGRERIVDAVAQGAAEFVLHLQVGQVRDVPDHARDAQPPARQRSLRPEMPPWKSGSVMIAWRATSLNAMFCADRFGAAAITSAWRTRCG
jgi:hypothetical protein